MITSHSSAHRPTLRRRALLKYAGAAAVAGGFGSASATRPRVGITLPLTGVQATVGNEMRQGYVAALSSVVELEILDDQAKPELAAKNTSRFAASSGIVVASGFVSTPSAKSAIPVAVDGQLPLVGVRSGADSLRDGNPFVFHLRASYEDEVEKVLEVASIYGSLAVLYHDDDFGRGTLAHAEKIAAARGMKVGLKLPVDRNSSNVRDQVAKVAAAVGPQGVNAMLLALIEQPALAVTREARNVQKLIMPIFGMSIIATSTLAASTDPAFEGLSLVSPYLHARTAVAEMARTFRASMTAAGTENLIASPTAFEGYFYGSVVADAIEHGGPSRKAVQAYLMQQRLIEVKQVALRFDQRRVGYRYLTLLRKQGPTLRT